MPTDSKARVFVSHTSKDKPFVRKLVEALKGRDLNVWLDERELQVGDSIVAGVSQGLKNADYLVAVLSKASISSRWVQAELNATLMEELSGEGVTVLPLLIEDCELPMLLKDRVYADFRHDFNAGLQKLLAVFEQEGESAANAAPEVATKSAPCSQKLSAITLADLRRRMTKRMDRGEVSALWFAVLETTMENDMAGRQLSECVISLLDKAKSRNKLPLIIEEICQDRPDLADPLAGSPQSEARTVSSDTISPRVAETRPVAKLQAPEPAVPGAPREPIVDFEDFRRYVPAKLIGREDQTNALSLFWAQAQVDEVGRPLVVAMIGMGGAGKSSLVAQWAASLGDQGWPGCDAVLAWSFYSQGTREVASVSAGHFLKYALALFGDRKIAGSSAKAAVKGRRLAELIGEQHTLLILDGLEPLQYPPTDPMAGQLRDTGLSALLQGLAEKNRGLCIVTTRIAVQDLNTYLGRAVREEPLGGLSEDAGALLLQKLGVVGDMDLMKRLAKDVRGHALTLTLLGSFLKRAYGGNIAKRDQVKLEKADATVQGGHAFRTMEAYEQWLLQGGDEGRREVAILQLMGLFDRPAAAESIGKLRAAVLRGFNEPLVGLSDEDLLLSLSRLEDAHLLSVDRHETGELKSIDAHPLMREYFAGKIAPETRKRAETLLASNEDEYGGESGGGGAAPDAGPKRDLVFISYSDTDKSWRDIIRKFLESDPDIRGRLWDDNDIPAGRDFSKETVSHLAQARAIIMITSPAYVDPSPGARHIEIKTALEATSRDEMDILWIPAKAHRYQDSPVGHIMAATGPGAVALEDLRGDKRDSALLRLLTAVRRSLGLPVAAAHTQEQNAGDARPEDRLQSALALSGGGFRATFFHLGVLAFHFRHGALGKLNIITAVSGGSILAAHAVLHWETLKQHEAGFHAVMAKLVTLARSNVRDGILVRWLWALGTGWRFLGTPAQRLARSRTGRLIHAYRSFYERQSLESLQQPGRPWLALVATDLYHRSRVYFSHDGMRRIAIDNGRREEPFPQRVEVDVAFAVAASSCFPPIFRPLVLDYQMLRVRWDSFRLSLRLQDGGVHDNLGLRALQLIAPPEKVALGTIHASYAVNPDQIRKPGTGWWADLMQALRLFTQGEKAEIANDIATLAGAEAVITKFSDYVPMNAPHLLDTGTQTELMSFRTDLDAPTWQEMYALMAHGYQVAAMNSRYLDEGDFSAARSLFCAIMAESLAEENGTTPQQEMPAMEKIVSDLSAKQLHRCGVRPKGRIAIHLVLYLLLLFIITFSANRYGSSIAALIYHFYKASPNVSDTREMRDFSVEGGPVIRGRIEIWGGPDDLASTPEEGLGLISEQDLQENTRLKAYFLPSQPAGTTGLTRRLDTKSFYVSARWNLAHFSKDFLRTHLVTVTNSQNGRSAQAQPVDWGPAISIRAASISPGLADYLQLKEDGEVVITIPEK